MCDPVQVKLRVSPVVAVVLLAAAELNPESQAISMVAAVAIPNHIRVTVISTGEVEAMLQVWCSAGLQW